MRQPGTDASSKCASMALIDKVIVNVRQPGTD